jgi:hypothetical protein
MLKVGSATPWGVADFVKVLAPGVVMVCTPSHGGIWLSRERCDAMPRELAGVPTFVERSVGRMPSAHGGRWYEEDCDVALVALAFPELFPREFVAGPAGVVASRYSPVVAVWLDRLPANDIRRGGAAPALVAPLVLTGSDRPADAPGQGALL